MSSNSYQIGGDHYRSEYQHWDLVLIVGMGYLEASATKYVARHRKKGSAALDLEKALHYVEKIKENSLGILQHETRISQPVGLARVISKEVAHFAELNYLNNTEREIIELLAVWRIRGYLGKLETAQLLINKLLGVEFKSLPDPKPVPLTEENMHAQETHDKE